MRPTASYYLLVKDFIRTYLSWVKVTCTIIFHGKKEQQHRCVVTHVKRRGLIFSRAKAYDLLSCIDQFQVESSRLLIKLPGELLI